MVLPPRFSWFPATSATTGAGAAVEVIFLYSLAMSAIIWGIHNSAASHNWAFFFLFFFQFGVLLNSPVSSAFYCEWAYCMYEEFKDTWMKVDHMQ